MKIEIHSPAIGRKEMEAVLAVLVEEKIGPGEQSQRLLQAAKEKLQFDYALSLRSPAIALSLALKSFKSGVCGEAEENRGVLISALSPRYYLEVLNELGLEPVICDVDGASASISVESARSAIENSKNGVFCAVIFETLGFMPEAGLFEALGVPIIEDCSLSFGSMLEGRQAGSFGTLSILGLEERDMLTSGGGAILFAMERRNDAVLRGFSSLPPEYDLPDMNAAMAFVQIREYKRSVERLNEIERLYKDGRCAAGGINL